jgi:predicted acyltransferase
MTTASTEPKSAETSNTSQRLMSVDALRGFDMFWIIGADSLVAGLNQLTKSRPASFLADQLEHAEWEGFHFEDLIFPLFVFIVGVSLVFSLGKTLQQAGRGEALRRVFRRSVLLFLVALFYSGGFSHPWPDIRLLGVLNRIALAYCFAGLLFCFLKPRALVGVCCGLLVVYWALMTFVPIRDIQLTKPNLARLAEQNGDPGTAALFQAAQNPSTVKDSSAWSAAENMFWGTTKWVRGKYGPGYNVSDHLDFQYLPGKKWDNFYDPEGYLSTIPAVATCLLGVFAGLLLKNQSVPDKRKVLYLVAFGIAGALVGWLWNLQFPVIKKIWTSSYVLVAGGYSAILLGIFYLIVDIWRVRAWCQPFVWIGMNSITIYLASNILGGEGFVKLATRLAGGDVRTFFDQHLGRGAGELVVAIVGLGLAFWFVHFLYRRKIFLRL